METTRDKIFWYSVKQIRELFPMFEVTYGTKVVFRAARELVKHFKYAEKKKGKEWALENFDEHIFDYIMEEEEKAHGAKNYVPTAEIHECD